MIIDKPTIRIKDKKAIYSSIVEFENENVELYFSIDEKFSYLLASSSDPLLISMLIPCMQNAEDLEIKGKISLQLHNNLNEIQDILCVVIPHLHKINVFVDNIVDEFPNNTKNVFTGFSAGIDSFVTFDDYFLNPKDLKVTHFLFNNINHKDYKIDIKLNNISKIVKKYNFPLIQTKTNLHNFYKKHRNIGFEQTHTIRNASVPHFLSGVHNIFLYSSTFHKDLIQIVKSNDLAIVDDILLPLLSTPLVECRAVGSEYTRVDKTIKVSEMEDAYKYLDTCIGDQSKLMLNCGVCRKCTRALATFELVNKKENFDRIFNLQDWNKIRKQYLLDLPTRTQLNDRELYEYIQNIKE